MKQYFMMLAICVMAVGMTGCSSDSEPEKAEVAVEPYTRAEVALKSIEELPAWLSEIVARIEKAEGLETSLMSIYQCEWKGKQYYFVYNGLKSCIWCDSVYDGDGRVLEWDYEGQSSEFSKESTAWLRIYDWLD